MWWVVVVRRRTSAIVIPCRFKGMLCPLLFPCRLKGIPCRLKGMLFPLLFPCRLKGIPCRLKGIWTAQGMLFPLLSFPPPRLKWNHIVILHSFWLGEEFEGVGKN
jgi:hypothetical protein